MDIEKAKKVMEELKENKYGELLNCYDQGEEAERAIEVVLNELDKKDKIINEMAKWIEKHTGYAIDETLYKESKEYIIDYFTKKVEEK